MPFIAADREVFIGFTSGSTGHPRPHPKRWGDLVGCARAAARRFGFGPEYSIVATVVPQHMYGMELSIMVPFATGAARCRRPPLLSGRHPRRARKRTGSAHPGDDTRASRKLCRGGLDLARRGHGDLGDRPAAADAGRACRVAAVHAGARNLRQHRDRLDRQSPDLPGSGVDLVRQRAPAARGGWDQRQGRLPARPDDARRPLGARRRRRLSSPRPSRGDAQGRRQACLAGRSEPAS